MGWTPRHAVSPLPQRVIKGRTGLGGPSAAEQPWTSRAISAILTPATDIPQPQLQDEFVPRAVIRHGKPQPSSLGSRQVSGQRGPQAGPGGVGEARTPWQPGARCS